MIATSLLYYINHLGSIDYLATIINSVSSAELCNIINELLQSENYETVSLTCLFIRDLVLFGSPNPDCEKFCQGYSESSIVKTLEQLLFSPNLFICQEVVYTLGQTCSYSSLPMLNQAFSALRDINPILLPRLIGEMGWLGTENFWALLESMVTSPVYMTRWAVIDVLSEFVGDDARVQDELFQRKFKFTEQLRRDSNILIQSEAEYEYQVLKFRSETYNLPKAERKKKRKDLERHYKPKFCFAHLSIAFTNYLYTKGLSQYSVGELEAFISNMTQTYS
ncbi:MULTISPECIES: HEAT repeat domain-containing protein [unclassified Microcoleus]|uniref:HEAT repeat domain-containing protein n=1 Tax=unclassified Microcoleus TaxID=2642155 RepID=UPI002FD29C70